MPAGVCAKMFTPNVEIPTNVFPHGEYAYDLFAHDFGGTRMFEHGGTLPGYNAEVRALPAERVAVVVLSNRDGVRLNKTFAEAFALALPSLKAQAADAVVAQPEAPLPLSAAGPRGSRARTRTAGRSNSSRAKADSSLDSSARSCQ